MHTMKKTKLIFDDVHFHKLIIYCRMPCVCIYQLKKRIVADCMHSCYLVLVHNMSF